MMKAGASILLAALLLAIGYIEFGIAITDGKVVKAKVLRLGTHPVAGSAGGNLPIVTVRLPDGSVRQVKATWADVDNCKPSRWLSLLKYGTALQIAQPGCGSLQ